MNNLSPLNTAVLFITYKRLDTTIQVFESIRKAKPPRIYISSNTVKDEDECKNVQIVRDYIIDNIDWECEVHKLFRTKHLSAKLSISGAIDWFFEHEEMGIILEDDCLPHPDFFLYCEIMLNRYRNSNNVMFISGDNFQDGIKRNNYSYYFSSYCNVWGWATWKRVWDHYSLSLSEFSEDDLVKILKHRFSSKEEQAYWKSVLMNVKQSMIDTWDYQINLTVWNLNGVSIIPNVNLISNIGFGNDATHTKVINKDANLQTSSILPISSPNDIVINKEADRYYYKRNLRLYFMHRIIKKLKSFTKHVKINKLG